jgi:PAS domain S-box-containing protein
VSDASGRIVLANASARAQIRRHLPEGMPSTWEALVRALVAAGAYPEASGREDDFVAERLAMVSTEGTAHELQFDDRHLLASDQRLPDGSVVHLKIDVTDHRRAELALAEQEMRLRALVRALPDLWLVIDAEGRYLESAGERHPLLVRPFSEIRGRRVDELLPADIAARSMDAIRRAIATGEVQRIEYPLRTGGGEHSFEARIAPMGGDRTLYLLRDMTEVRQLARDVQLMQHVMEAENALPMSVADATQPDLPLVYVNTAFERLTGYSRAEVLGRNCRFLQHGVAEHPARAALRTALNEGRACTVLLRNRRRDGSLFINELHVAPIRDADGRLTHFIGVQSDVTERSQAAERLAYSEALYRSVAGAISDGLLVADPEGRIVTLNPAACALIGSSAVDLSGRALGELGFELRREDGRPLEPDDHPVREALREGRRVERTYLVLRPDHVRLLLQVSLQPLRFGAQVAPPYFVITLRDISAQRSAQAALAQAEARWKLALDGAGDGVWDYDEDTRVAFFSPTWKRMLGHEEREVGPRLEEWFSRIHPDDRQRVVGALDRYRAGGAPAYREQYRLRHRDGHWLWVDDFGHIVERRDDGSARRLVGVHSDVTRQRLADQALRDKQAAELASRAKSEFLSRMSHEMRTPLNAVIGFTQLLRLQGGNDRHKLAQYSEHILAAGQHLLALVNDVLDLQQVEEGRLSLTVAPMGLDGALAEALELTRPLARPRGIELRSDVPQGVRENADAQRLRQVLLNVLSNGVKYNRDGGVLRCALEAGNGGCCVLLIEDSGLGLSREQLARLFQPFERLGLESSGIEGSGLGLIIARQLMREMHGNLRINSRPGMGTQVRLDLPLTVEDSAHALAAAAPAEPPPTTAWTTHLDALAEAAPAPALRMLYVEDNRINALLFEEAIRLRGGVELRVAEDGEEALALVAQWLPDVLVLDAHLPGMSGYELLRALRHVPGLEEAPAFMCSADAMPDDVQRAKAAGFHGYWTKPIDIARVMQDLDALRLQTTAG